MDSQTFCAIGSINSSKIVFDKYEAFPLPLFPYFNNMSCQKRVIFGQKFNNTKKISILEEPNPLSEPRNDKHRSANNRVV